MDGPTSASLGRAGRGWRSAAFLVGLALLTAGAGWGDDVDWPFGPLRMFSTSTPVDGSVYELEVWATDGRAWHRVPPGTETVGLNRAELEGQLPRFQREPGRIGVLAATYAEHHPREPRWTGARLVRHETLLHGGGPTGLERRTVVASWTAP